MDVGCPLSGLQRGLSLQPWSHSLFWQMDQGCGLVPVYAFGENSLFRHEPRWLLKGWKWVNKFLKLGAPFPIRGAMGFPIPFR